MDKDIIICSCYSIEHQIVFHYGDLFEEDYPNYVYVNFHLVDYGGFWKRLKYAWKYLWGHTSNYGAWDEFIISVDDIHKFEDVVKYLKMIKAKEDKHEKERLEKLGKKMKDIEPLPSNPDAHL